VGAGGKVRIDLADHVAHDHRGDTHHQTGIDPVIQMAGPTDNKLRQASQLKGFLLGQKRLLGEEVAGASPRVELG